MSWIINNKNKFLKIYSKFLKNNEKYVWKFREICKQILEEYAWKFLEVYNFKKNLMGIYRWFSWWNFLKGSIG
jgi:hypothetical protein